MEGPARDLLCGPDATLVAGREEAVASCTIPGRYPGSSANSTGSAHVLAIARAGQLHVSIAQSGYADPGGTYHTTATAWGYWDDRLMFGAIPVGVTPAFIDITARARGSVAGSITGGEYSLVSVASSFTVVTGHGATTLFAETGTALADPDPVRRARPLPAGTTFDAFGDSYDVAQIIRVPFSTQLDVTLSLLAYDNLYAYGFQGYLSPTIPGGYVPSSGSTLADFANTAGVASVAVIDASGADITSQLSFAWDNGLQYYNPSAATTAPEPGTIELLATGLVILAGTARRRRAA